MTNNQSNPGRSVAWFGIALLGLIAGWAAVARTWESAKSVAHPGSASVSADLPVSFEPNQGQSDDSARFVARGPGYTLILNSEGVTFRFSNTLAVSPARTQSLVLTLVGADHDSKLQGQDEQASKSSYFLGSDPKKWLTGIPNFAEVHHANAYPGVDLTYRGLQGSLQYEFKVAPRTHASVIALDIAGAKNLHLNRRGDLIFTALHTVMQLVRPVAYQDRGGVRHDVPIRYILRKNRVTFALGGYDSAKPLMIHPTLRYSDSLRFQEAETTLPAVPPIAVPQAADQPFRSIPCVAASARASVPARALVGSYPGCAVPRQVVEQSQCGCQSPSEIFHPNGERKNS